MLIVDGQIHVWAADRPDRPWPKSANPIPHANDAPLGPDEALARMDAAGVGAAVLVPPSFEGVYNDLSRDAVAAHPNRFCTMGRISLDSPMSSSEVQAFRTEWNLMGFRLVFNDEEMRQQMVDGGLDWFWTACTTHDIPLMILGGADLEHFDQLAGRFPDIRFTLDHCNMGRTLRGGIMSEEEFTQRMVGVCGLARHPNVSVKVSALTCYLDIPDPFTFLTPLVYQVIEAYGERAFWGSDVSRLNVPYERWRDFFVEDLTELTPAQLASVMGEGLIRWFGLPEGFGVTA